MSWQETHPVDLHEGQRVRQGWREGCVLTWNWRAGRNETVVDVMYDNLASPDLPGDFSQWVVAQGRMVTAWVEPSLELTIARPRLPLME